jgi:hypothetical protein
MSRDAANEGSFSPLADADEQILLALLAEAFPGRDELVRQIRGTLCRRIDADGSLALRPGPGPRAEVEYRVPVTGTTTDVDGVGIEVLMHVVDGYLDEVEIYRHDGGPILGPINPSSLHLIVLPATG